VIPVAVGSALALALVAIGDAVAVTVPAARHIVPLLAAADDDALRYRGYSGSLRGQLPNGRIPTAVIEQAV
jgi:hypothetical protein